MFLQVNILWPAVAAAVNRDQKNQQKTTLYAGIRRPRWSSQSQKAATRTLFRSRVAEQYTAVRTRQWEQIAERLVEAQWPPLLARQAAFHVYQLVSGGDGAAMVLVRADFAEAAAQVILDNAETVRDAIALALKKPGKDTEDEEREFYKDYAERAKTVERRFADKATGKEEKRRHHEAVQRIIDTILRAEGNVDIAFNGRMIAENDGYNVDAAVHVAHAVGVDAWDDANWDYFTGIDELTGDAAMLGERPNGTALYFRTATVDLAQAHATLGGDWEDVVAHATSWADAFVRALPSSMQTSTMATSAPIMAAVCVSRSPLHNLVAFCADPISGRRQYPTAVDRLIREHHVVNTGFASAGTMHYWTSVEVAPGEGGESTQAHPLWELALAAAAAELREVA